jgi:hypothetical protein
MWQYDIATDKLTLLTKFDPARFGDANLAATAPFTVDEETSGIIDMEDILGPGWFLFDAQAHYTTGIAPELVEGGQLLALYNPALDQKLFKDTTTDVFNMPANGSKLNVSLQVKSNAVSEVGVFVVDNSSGAIRGVLPGAPGYEQLALEQIGRGNGRVIASNLAYLPSGFKLNLGISPAFCPLPPTVICGSIPWPLVQPPTMPSTVRAPFSSLRCSRLRTWAAVSLPLTSRTWP